MLPSMLREDLTWVGPALLFHSSLFSSWLCFGHRDPPDFQTLEASSCSRAPFPWLSPFSQMFLWLLPHHLNLSVNGGSENSSVTALSEVDASSILCQVFVSWPSSLPETSLLPVIILLLLLEAETCLFCSPVSLSTWSSMCISEGRKWVNRRALLLGIAVRPEGNWNNLHTQCFRKQWRERAVRGEQEEEERGPGHGHDGEVRGELIVKWLSEGHWRFGPASSNWSMLENLLSPWDRVAVASGRPKGHRAPTSKELLLALLGRSLWWGALFSSLEIVCAFSRLTSTGSPFEVLLSEGSFGSLVYEF